MGARSLKNDPTHLFLENMAWLAPENREKPIPLTIKGERLELPRDLDRIVSYYEAKPPDLTLLPNSKPPKALPECAEDLRRNVYQLRVHDPKVTLPEDLSWSENPFDDPSWEFWFHQWRFAPCLMDGYLATRDDWYLRRLMWVVEDWWRKNFRPDPPSDFSWYDHTVPLRLRSLMTIWEFVRRHGGLTDAFVKTVIRLVYWHGRILDEEAAFQRHDHNHGLDQAFYLYRTSIVFPEIERAAPWRENALARVKRELEFSVTDEGVQKENSPGYHQHTGAYLFRIMESIERDTGEIVSPRIRGLENALLTFNVVIAQPDGYLPQIGDTAPGVPLRSRLPNLTTLAWYPHYEHVVSGREHGTPPHETRFIFPDSGYYIYRDTWGPDAIHLVMTCGFLAEGHRHDDDGHISLYGLGEPWLTDAGRFGHVIDPRRAYVISAKAHNVSIPDDARPDRALAASGGPETGITDYDRTGLSWVACQSRMHKGYLYQRRLTVIAPRTFEITDRLRRAEGDHHGAVATQFRIPSDKAVSVDHQQGRVRALSETGRAMEISFDPSTNSTVDLLHGDDGTDLSFDTAGPLQVEPVTTVRFNGTLEPSGYAATFRVALLDRV